MTGAPEPPREPVPPPVALGFTLVGFVALVIAGLGVVGLATDDDLVTAPGLGPWPGVVAILVAGGVFALIVSSALRRAHPSFWNALWAGIGCFLGYLLGAAVGVLLAGGDPAVAVGVAGRIATSWFGVIVVVAALVASWSAIALVRTEARRPRWPWERDAE